MSGPSADALFVALVLAPGTYGRNRYYTLFQEETLWRARRRAQVIRSMVRDLTEPWPEPGPQARNGGPDFYEERTEADTVCVEYRISDLDYRRSAVLSKLEAATLRYALSQNGKAHIAKEDARLVEEALQSLGALPDAS